MSCAAHRKSSDSTQDAARLEGSKIHSKEFMQRLDSYWCFARLKHRCYLELAEFTYPRGRADGLRREGVTLPRS
jgi:hypothetical protein